MNLSPFLYLTVPFCEETANIQWKSASLFFPSSIQQSLRHTHVVFWVVFDKHHRTATDSVKPGWIYETLKPTFLIYVTPLSSPKPQILLLNSIKIIHVLWYYLYRFHNIAYLFGGAFRFSILYKLSHYYNENLFFEHWTVSLVYISRCICFILSSGICCDCLFGQSRQEWSNWNSSNMV